MAEDYHQGRDAPMCDAPATVTPDSLNNAIGTIESFVQGQEWPLRLQNAWKRVKDAAVNKTAGAEMRAPELRDDENIRAIKTQLEGLTKMVRNLSEPVTAPAKPSYTEMLCRASPITRASERVAPVPARRVREIVIAPGNESLTQRQRSGREIVSDINIKLGGEGVVAAR